MAITTDDETHHTETTVVEIRIPVSEGEGLTAAAETRLAGVTGIRAATVTEIRGISPSHSATTVTVGAAVETADRSTAELLADAAFVTLVE